MGYYNDLTAISMQAYGNQLKDSELLPSRKMLKDNLDEHFDRLKSAGIGNLADLQQAMKTKQKLEKFANATGIPVEYLKTLNREINSIHPKPNKLSDFSEISDDTLHKLEKNGFKTTLQLFDQIKTPNDRLAFYKQHNIPEDELLNLTKLTDVSRVRWVGSTFARVLVVSGYDSVEKIASADYNELFEVITSLNKEKMLYKGNIGLNDMKLTVLAAKEVSVEIVF